MSDAETTEKAQPVPIPEPHTSQKRPRWPLALLLVVLAIAGLGAWQFLSPAPDLEPARRLAEAGNYPEAKTKLKSILAYDPSNREARLLMAEVSLNLDPPEPAEVLRVLDGLRITNRPQAAFAQVMRGKAERLANRPAKAEAAWREALRLDPLVAEAGWLLIQLYYTEGRNDELRELALRLHRNEPDPDDRVRLLLEPMRPDAEPLSAAGIVPVFKATVEADSDDKYATLAYYRAMVEDGTGADKALPALRALYEHHPDDPACLDGLIAGLIASGDVPGLEKILTSLAPEQHKDRRLAYARGWLAREKGDTEGAIREYTIALADHPSDKEILYRLKQAYVRAGKDKEAGEIESREKAVEDARVELRGIRGKEAEIGRPGLFDEAMGRTNLGRSPDPALYKRLAKVRETMGHPDEALAWYRLAAKADPADAESREAVARLDKKADDKKS